MVFLSLLVGCAGYTPSASLGELQVRSLSMEGAEGLVQVVVDNPWPVSADVGADWSLVVAGVEVASGHAPEGAVAASSPSVIEVPIHWRWVDLWSAAGAMGDEVPYGVSLDVHGTTALGAWHLPVATEGTLPAVRLPSLGGLGFVIDEVSLVRLAARVTAVVDVPLRDLDWAVRVGAVPLFHGRLERGEGALAFPLVVEIGQATAALVTALQQGLGLQLKATVVTPLGDLPVDLQGQWP